MKAKVIIVNEKDEIIDYKERGTIEQNDIYRVSGIVIKNNNGEFLLAQRSFNKKNNPGEWSVSAAGTIEKGENYDDNIFHEIEEELGINGLKYKKLTKLRIHGKHNFFCQFYTAILDKNLDYFSIQKEEVENLRRFTIDEIKSLKFEGYPISETLIKNLDLFI